MQLNIVEAGAYFIGFVGTAGGVFAFFRYGDYKTTVKLQNDSIKALQDNLEITNAELEKAKRAHLEYVKNIGVLEGQVTLYKDLQLDKMASAMDNISKTNEQILATLKGSAVIAARQQADKGVKVDPSEAIA